jgi:hypothetical protein
VLDSVGVLLFVLMSNGNKPLKVAFFDNKTTFYCALSNKLENYTFSVSLFYKI